MSGGGGGAHERGCRTGERIGDSKCWFENRTVSARSALLLFLLPDAWPSCWDTAAHTRTRAYMETRADQSRPEQSRAGPASDVVTIRSRAGHARILRLQLNKANQRPCQRNETKRSAAQRRLCRLLMWLCGRRAVCSMFLSQSHRGPERSNIPFNVLRSTRPPVPGNGRRRRIGRRRTCLETVLCHG